MEITFKQYKSIKKYLPVQRGNVKLSNLKVLNAILYVAEQGCKWRGLPKKFGYWHSIYTRANRWAKYGVLDRVFSAMQESNVIRLKLDNVSLDSSIIKVILPPVLQTLYKKRNGVERLFCRLKGFRRIFSRFEKVGRLE